MGYLEATEEFYRSSAITPNEGLCCTTTPVWQLPGLTIPGRMLEMNYGCGTTVHPRDLANSPRILYVGVGGGMELLQFAYFSRQEGGVIGIDPVAEMREACADNLRRAEAENDWFRADFVSLRQGNALSLPLEDESIDVAAQNCLFNIFEPEHLAQALREMRRVLKPHGRLVLSDPICEQPLPEALRRDERLRAECLSGCLSLAEYLQIITDAGFGTVEVRARRLYRLLAPPHYDTRETLVLESVEVAAIKDPMPDDGPCVFTGQTAIYYGPQEFFDDGKGHLLAYNRPLAVCDKTACALRQIADNKIYISPSTYFYDGGGCC
jgi:SAM-dependent methyltransferase